MSLPQLNPVEPPWYGPVCPVVGEGWHREVSPYPDQCAAGLMVPLITARTATRADLFSTVLIAAFVAILWRYHTTGRARLWLLPVLMIVWVNTHLGFFVGLGLIGIYVGFEVLEVISAPSPQQEGAPPSVGHCRKWLAR